jgi:hypothetical protein
LAAGLRERRLGQSRLSGFEVKPISYSLQFRGQATSQGSNLLRLELTAPSAAFVTTVGAMGVRGRFEDVSGGEAVLKSELVFEEDSTFADSGTIEFGRGSVLRFRGSGGRLTHCPDPHLRHGAVVRCIEGGEGQFAG